MDDYAARLVLIATPIGNVADLSLRAIDTLKNLPVLACEDTRKTRYLLTRHGIEPPAVMFSCHEHNEESAAGRIVNHLAMGESVGLCSNAGYPSLSDPGFRTVQKVIDAGFQLEVIPGASSIPTALVYSGLPASSFTFLGFLPRKPGPRKRIFEREMQAPHTLVILESPYRIQSLLEGARETLGDRRAALCIELTKKFERIYRGTLSALITQVEGRPVKGEIVVVIAGA